MYWHLKCGIASLKWVSDACAGLYLCLHLSKHGEENIQFSITESEILHARDKLLGTMVTWHLGCGHSSNRSLKCTSNTSSVYTFFWGTASLCWLLYSVVASPLVHNFVEYVLCVYICIYVMIGAIHDRVMYCFNVSCNWSGQLPFVLKFFYIFLCWV